MIENIGRMMNLVKKSIFIAAKAYVPVNDQQY
jgi:hypothetical protein